MNEQIKIALNERRIELKSFTEKLELLRRSL